MNSNKFNITIASLPNREKLVAEICYNNELWIEISQETAELRIQCYPSQKKAHREFPLNELLNTIELAKQRLLEGQFPKSCMLD